MCAEAQNFRFVIRNYFENLDPGTTTSSASSIPAEVVIKSVSEYRVKYWSMYSAHLSLGGGVVSPLFDWWCPPSPAPALPCPRAFWQQRSTLESLNIMDHSSRSGAVAAAASVAAAAKA